MKTIFSRSVCLFAAIFSLAAAVSAGQAPVTVDADLVIRVQDMSERAVFYEAEVDGVVAEFFAVKAPDNTIRVVVNACQSCGPAGFQQIGENFRCTACGQDFHITAIERQKGGCNPIPVGENNKVIGQDAIVLPLAFLRKVTGSRYAKGRRR